MVKLDQPSGPLEPTPYYTRTTPWYIRRFFLGTFEELFPIGRTSWSTPTDHLVHSKIPLVHSDRPPSPLRPTLWSAGTDPLVRSDRPAGPLRLTKWSARTDPGLFLYLLIL